MQPVETLVLLACLYGCPILGECFLFPQHRVLEESWAFQQEHDHFDGYPYRNTPRGRTNFTVRASGQPAKPDVASPWDFGLFGSWSFDRPVGPSPFGPSCRKM